MRFYTPLLAILLFFSILSCNKENIDITTEEVDFMTEIIECDLMVDIVEDPWNILNAQVSGGEAPYIYTWSTGEQTEQISVVEGGIYSVMVTDAGECMVEVEFDFIGPCELEMTIVEDPIGTLSMNISNAVGDVRYLWSSGETTQTIEVLNNGRFRGDVRGENCCRAFDEVLVNLPGPCQNFIAEVVSGTNPFILNAITSGGTPPYSFLWSTGDTTSTLNTNQANQNVLPTLDLEVSDSEGCIFTTSFQNFIISPFLCEALTLTIVENPKGTLRASASLGCPPYSYQWTTGEEGSTIDAEVNSPTSFGVFATDSDGCVRAQFITISP